LRAENGDDRPVLEVADALGLGLQANLDIGAGAIADAALVERETRMFEVLGMNDQRVVLAEQFTARVAEQRFDAAVDENETTVPVEGVDDVRRLLDEKTVQTLGVVRGARSSARVRVRSGGGAAGDRRCRSVPAGCHVCG
jgi:hypothetical protein